jgi:hypothetical protein
MGQLAVTSPDMVRNLLRIDDARGALLPSTVFLEGAPHDCFRRSSLLRGYPVGHRPRLLRVDSTGQSYVVLGYEVVREPFWKRPRTPFGRGVRLTGFRLSHQGSWSLQETKARVIAAVEADAEHWDAGQDRQELVRMIGAAEDMRSLLRVLSVP